MTITIVGGGSVELTQTPAAAIGQTAGDPPPIGSTTLGGTQLDAIPVSASGAGAILVRP